VVSDVAGPVPIGVVGARLAALAAGTPPPDPQDDPDLQADVAAALASLPVAAGGPGSTGPSIVGAELAAGPDGTDLAVRLLIRPAPRASQNTPAPQASQNTKDRHATEAATHQARQEAVQQTVQQAAEAIAGRLASRLRRGIQFSAALAPATSVTSVTSAATPAAPVSAASAVPPAPVPSRPHE
jgi:hypothetical protein